MSQAENQKEAIDPEVVPKAKKRQYSAEYKRRVLQEYEACTEPGARGALLRREGLYSSNITNWRRQRERGELAGLTTKKRGPKVDPQAVENVRLRRENERLKKRLEQAELIIDVQKKLSQLLANHVACRTPGRHIAAGVHHGRDRVMVALVSPADERLRDICTEVTEIVVDARRAVVVIRTTGRLCDVVDVAPIDVEVALHLQTDGERILAITEYNDDQHALDRILGGAPSEAPERTGRWRRWWRRTTR